MLVPPPPHAWTVPLVEDMLCYARTGLTEAIVTGPGRAILFYGRQSLGEGLSLGKARDAAFAYLLGWALGLGNQPILPADPFTGPRRSMGNCPGHNRMPDKGERTRASMHVNLSTPQPFRFDCPGNSPQQDTPGDANSHCQPLLCQPPRGWDQNRCRRDLEATTTLATIVFPGSQVGK